MSAAQKLSLTEQEYLDGERHSDVKHEFIEGLVYAMTGATDDHNRISGNVFGELRQQLKGLPCEAFFADMMVKAGPNYFYPDVMVLCGDDEADTSRIKHAPTVIVEVLSPTTRKTDITIKKIAYLNLPSLREYLLIEQDKCEIVVFRHSQSWAATYYVLGDIITLDSIGVSLSVEEIYERVMNDDMAAFLTENDAG